MTGHEISKKLEDQRNKNHQFVRWWRKEEDFVDYELVDGFVKNTAGNEEFGGFDLLTMDDMWGEVKRLCGTRIRLLEHPSGDKIEWVHHGKTGSQTQVCPFAPETLMTIFDVETKGNPVDS